MTVVHYARLAVEKNRGQVPLQATNCRRLQLMSTDSGCGRRSRRHRNEAPAQSNDPMSKFRCKCTCRLWQQNASCTPYDERRPPLDHDDATHGNCVAATPPRHTHNSQRNGPKTRLPGMEQVPGRELRRKISPIMATTCCVEVSVSSCAKMRRLLRRKLEHMCHMRSERKV